MVRRIPEILSVCFGVALRASMYKTYDVRLGYDADDHWPYIQWFANHSTLPPLMLCRETYHPPLYYAIAGAEYHRFGAAQMLTLPSIIFSSLTLLVLWWALERHLVGYRLARIVALALAAVLPAAVHLTGMLNAEGLNSFLSLLALVLGAELGARSPWRPYLLAVGLGLVLGLGMLTKISVLVIITVVFAGGGLKLLWDLRERRSLARAARLAAPWAVAGAVLLATCGWYFARNQRLYGKAILTGFDGVDSATTPHVEGTPYLDRRDLGFFVGWSNDIFVVPYWPSGVRPWSRFWPVLLATTFHDYYNYGYARPPASSPIVANDRTVPPAFVPAAQASLVAGAVIAASTVSAWLALGLGLWRRRDVPRLLLWAAPAVALAGQLHFVVKYPFDYQGPIKAMYLQFAAGPLFALFGLAVSWSASRRWRWPLLGMQVVALVTVAAYTCYARASWL
jgi:hypothetical protein